jgi:hypothetical protein
MLSIPSGLNDSETKIMEKRRKLAIRIMNDMDILNISRGQGEEKDDERMVDVYDRVTEKKIDRRI